MLCKDIIHKHYSWDTDDISFPGSFLELNLQTEPYAELADQWGFYPWSKLFWNAWKCLENYVHLNLNVNHLLAWRQLIQATAYWIPSLRASSFNGYLEANGKADRWIQAQRKQIKAARLGILKNHEKQSPHSIQWIVPCFFSFIFHPKYYSALGPIGRHLWIMIWLWKKLDIRGLQKT